LAFLLPELCQQFLGLVLIDFFFLQHPEAKLDLLLAV
jgi:hypothetical protein